MVWRREVWRRCLLVVAVLPHAVSAFVAAPLSAGGPFHAPCLRRAAGGRALGKMQAEAGGHSPRRVALVGLGAMVALGLGAPIAPVVADSCTRKDCQVQVSHVPAGRPALCLGRGPLFTLYRDPTTLRRRAHLTLSAALCAT